MQDKDNFSFEPEQATQQSSQQAEPQTEQSKSSALNQAFSDKLLQQLIAALAPKPFHKRHPIIFWGGIGLIFFAIISSLLPGNDSMFSEENRIAVVRVEGMILDTKPTLEWIKEITEDDSVRGVLLRIDSPGGGAAASQEIYAALLELGKQKPIIASMGSTAASGGLMVAMAAEHIVANPSTVTGSIGVRMDVPQLQNIMEKIGIGQLTLKTGQFKDAGTFTRPMTEEERAYFENVLHDMHEQFIQLVAEGRKMPVEKIRPIADGRIFTGRAAKDLGLVDELGSQDNALAVLYKRTKIDSSTPLLEHTEDGQFFRELINGLLNIDFGQKLSNPAFLFQY